MYEKCKACDGSGLIEIPQPMRIKYDPKDIGGHVQHEKCKSCNGIGRIELRAMTYEGSRTHTESIARIKELEVKLEIAQRAAIIYRNEKDLYRIDLEKAFDAGFDAGFYSGFERASKENGKQIQKPKALSFNEFEKQKFGIV